MAEYDSINSENQAIIPATRANGVDEAVGERDFRSQVQQYGQQASDALNKAKGYAQEYIGIANDKIKDLQGKDLNQITEDAKDFARRKPVQAIAISAAVGVVVGLLLRRR
jgi:ElaB/YqjD/DUF883 family membrane-anchored ribosome-binding protein